MPISGTFVLGKKEAFFFNTSTHWAWHNLPPDIEALFTQTPAIKDVIDLALGTNGTYFVSYRDSTSTILCKHYNLPNALTSWLYASHPHIIRDLATLSITLGPYDSYYAWDKTSASWSNLPPKLEKSIFNRVESQDAWKTTWKAGGAEAPCFVSLGADEAYWMRTVSGGGCWDLKASSAPANPRAVDGMAGLRGTNKFLEESSDFSGVAGLHLFPSHPDAYILIKTDGKAFSNLPEFTWADYNKIASALPTFVQGLQPIPPMPQPRGLAQPQVLPPQPVVSPQPVLQQHQRPNCCPPGAPMSNCCVQTPMQPRPFGIPMAVPYYAQPVVQGFSSYGHALVGNGQQSGFTNGQQSGYTNGTYGAGPVNR